MEARTLLLTRSNLPHQVIGLEKAVNHLFTGDAEVVVEYSGDDHVLTRIPEARVFEDFMFITRSYPSYGGGELVIRTPSVMRMISYDGNVKRGTKFSRLNVYTRDGFRCQYCGKRQKMADLNYDHVIPRIQGGRTCWTNIVSSCIPCNSQKGPRTPEQAGMRLRKKPYEPKHLPSLGPRFDPQTLPPSWIPYVANYFGGYDEIVAA